MERSVLLQYLHASFPLIWSRIVCPLVLPDTAIVDGRTNQGTRKLRYFWSTYLETTTQEFRL